MSGLGLCAGFRLVKGSLLDTKGFGFRVLGLFKGLRGKGLGRITRGL